MKHLSEFWRSTLSNTLGAFFGIVLTFGTTFALQHYEQKKTERTAALMVIHNVDYFCEILEDDINDLEKRDSLNLIVWDRWADNQLPDDTLMLFLNSLLSRDFNCDDDAVEAVFSSNIETWTNIGNSEFIELAGKCFAAKHQAVKIRQEMDEEKQRLWYTFMKTIVYTDNPTESLHESVKRVFSTPEFCCFLRKQHQQYIPILKMSLMVLQEQNERNKQLMRVTDKELKEFGFNEHKNYLYEPE